MSIGCEETREVIDLGLPRSFTNAVRMNSKAILSGRVVAVDPGSTSPGYAVYEKGLCVDCGVIKPPKPKHLHHRLQYIATVIREITEGADLLIMEKISKPNSRTIITSYLPLIKSVGAIHSASQCEYMLEVSPYTWQKLAGKYYEKSDSADAMMLAECALYICRGG